MSLVNEAQVIGNIGQDPELRHTQSGTAVLSLRIATNESWMQDGEKKEKTEWHSVIVWGKRAEGLSKILSKGEKVAAKGRLETRSWETTDGAKRSTTEIVANDIVLLGGRQRRETGEYRQDNPTHGGPPGDDDIPF